MALTSKYSPNITSSAVAFDYFLKPIKQPWNYMYMYIAIWVCKHWKNCAMCFLTSLSHRLDCIEGVGNSIMVSVSFYHVGRQGSSPPRSICFRKVDFYQHAIDLSPPVLMTGSPKAVYVLSCLCDNACKRSLAICRKSRASCPVSRRPLSVPI